MSDLLTLDDLDRAEEDARLRTFSWPKRDEWDRLLATAREYWTAQEDRQTVCTKCGYVAVSQSVSETVRQLREGNVCLRAVVERAKVRRHLHDGVSHTYSSHEMFPGCSLCYALRATETP